MNRATFQNLATISVAALLVLTLTTVAVAQEKVDLKKKADADGTVVISNLAGSVTVTGWDKKEIHVEGTLSKEVERLDFEQDGSLTEIKVVLPDNVKNVHDTTLLIQVPKKSKVEVSTVSADISADRIEGALYLQSVSGDVLAAGKPAEIEIESVSGELEIEAETDMAHVQTVSGDVHLYRASGEINAETVSGDLQIEGGSFSRLDCQVVSGDVHFSGDLDKGGSFSFESLSGDLVLRLPGGVDADFDISTFSGDIDNDFGGAAERTSKYTPGKELRFEAGSGGARVRVNTFSGDVELHKK